MARGVQKRGTRIPINTNPLPYGGKRGAEKGAFFRRLKRMPYVRRRRIPSRTSKRATYKRRTGRKLRPRRRYVNPSKGLRTKWTNPIPAGASVKLKYIDNAFNGSTASPTYQKFYIFRGNSVFDPDYTGVGVQPYGYDQLTPSIYTWTQVKASAITLTWSIYSAAASQVKVFVFHNRAPTMLYSDCSDLRVWPGCRYRIASKDNGFTRKNWIKAYCSTKKALMHAWNDKDVTSPYNATPVLAWYWFVVFDTSDVAETVSITFDVKITYYTKLIRAGENINES